MERGQPNLASHLHSFPVKLLKTYKAEGVVSEYDIQLVLD